MKPMFRYPVHVSSPVDPILSYMNALRILRTHFLPVSSSLTNILLLDNVKKSN
jgi:hypothetical protein